MDDPIRLECGVGILRVFKDDTLTWKDMACEWIDNSFDACATMVTFTKAGRVLTIADDGHGCPDLGQMLSPASHLHYENTRAGKFGVGGVRAMVRASQGGPVTVTSITPENIHRAEMHWNECIDRDELFAKDHKIRPNLAGTPTGTTITIRNLRKFADSSDLIRDLGFYYAETLRHGKRIVLDIEGKPEIVKPYTPPSFLKQIDLCFNYEGYEITGFCGLIEPRTKIPSHGWHVHWAHRIMFRTTEPAPGKNCGRIFSVVTLPDSFPDVNSHKNALSKDHDGLWEILGNLCQPLIDEADSTAQEFELSEATQAIEGLLNGVINVKGRRPGPQVKEGTVVPTGNGTPHGKFTTTQHGNKAKQHGRGLIPDTIRIFWDDTLEQTYMFDASTRKGRTIIITLNRSLLDSFDVREHPDSIAMFCCPIIAREVTSNIDTRNMFTWARDGEYQDVLKFLLARLSQCIRCELPAPTPAN